MSYTKHDRIVSGAEIYASDIKDMDNKIYDHDSDISDLQDSVDVLEPTASASDVGKALKVKTVAGGKVTAYEFGETAIIDNTLSEAGKAADAKKTGDEITGLKSALDDMNVMSTEYKYTATSGYQNVPISFSAGSYYATRLGAAGVVRMIDENGNDVTSFRIPSNADNYLFTLTASEALNIAYLRFAGGSVAIKPYDNIVTRVSNLQSDTSVLKDILGSPEYTWVDDKTVNIDGTTPGSPGNSYAAVKVIPGHKIKGHTAGGGSVNRSIVFYNKNGIKVGGDSGDGVTNYDWDFDLLVPAMAYTANVSCRTQSKDSFWITCCDICAQVQKNSSDLYDENKKVNALSDTVVQFLGDKTFLEKSDYESGSLYVNNGAIRESANAKRARKIISTASHLSPNSKIYLSDYSHYRFIMFTSADNGSTWVQGSWVSSGFYLTSGNSTIYLIVIEDTTATTVNVDTLVSLLNYDDSEAILYDIYSQIGIINNKAGMNSKIAHFSFDDVQYCMRDLMANASTYTSIFDNAFFNMLKNLHDSYGALFSLYLFTTFSGGTIADYPSTFASEFTANADWLKFGLHQGGTNYASTTASAAKSDYDTFIDNIVRICGTVKSIDRCPRLGNFAGNLDSMIAMREADAGIVGLLSAYDDRDSYYLTSDDSAYVFKHGRYVDTTNRLTFYRTIKTFEVANPSTELAKLNTIEGVNGSDYAIMMMHEYGVYTDEYELVTSMANRIAYACSWVNDNGYSWDYPMNRILA